MRTRRLILAAILTGLAVLVTACSTGQANNAPDASSEEGVREETASRFAELLNENGVPGGVLVVRQGGTEQAYPVGVANESGAAVTDDTLFAYRSVTKSFVVTALLQLADEGVVDLDAPSTSQFDGMNPAVTPRQLAVMRSGVPNYSAQPELLSLIQENPERRWDDSELLSLVAGVPESFAPGTSYQYSNTNTVLIGQIIEAATGSAWSQVVKDRILTPLGLDSVVYPDNDTSITNIASPYAVDSDGAEALPVVQASAFSAAGGLYGTASDLAAWAEALGTEASSAPLCSKNVLNLFHPRPQTKPARTTKSTGWVSAKSVTGWGTPATVSATSHSRCTTPQQVCRLRSA